ncbi:phosphatase PAP2 family protein [Candidatus Protochlamydia naegleriophila]|uniref:phosphatase PAP2 family protein n=1 Tax=Candidatus Protochlamydia naegleriophila TaxID=389348 RepID=UPI001E6415B1|nr:phosphatase PAP2 family protein [Candidatus Protochlamydia naegleriophila]
MGKYYQNRKLYQAGWILTLFLGGALSLARIAQGGHFLSDILVSALIMWLTAAGLYQLLLNSDSS